MKTKRSKANDISKKGKEIVWKRDNKCINLKIRTKKGKKFGYCILFRKEVPIFSCNCNNKEYKKRTIKKKNCAKYTLKSTKMHNQSAKLRKLERNRFSLFNSNNDHCMICGSAYQLTWHEIFGGRNRPNSMRYGLCLRICLKCHETLQNDANFNEIWHKKGQATFIKTYPDLDFINIFHINYL